jgi:hypothetical protein
VAFVHHFGSSLNEHIHFHCIVTEGVFSEGPDGKALFHEASLREAADIEAVREKIRHRALKWLVRHEYLDRKNASSKLARRTTFLEASAPPCLVGLK